MTHHDKHQNRRQYAAASKHSPYKGKYKGLEAINRAARVHSRKLVVPFFFGLLYRERKFSGGGWKIRVNWKRLSLFSLAGIAVMWILGSVAVFCFYRYLREYKTLSFFQVVKAPWARNELTQSLGEYNIAEAKAMFEDGNYNGALSSLRKGVVRSPENLKARMDLAYISVAWFNNVDEAADILYAKLKNAFMERNEEYLSLCLSTFFCSSQHREDGYKLLNGILKARLLDSEKIQMAFANMARILSRLRNSLAGAEIFEKCASVSAPYDMNLAAFMASNASASYMILMENDKALKILKDYGIASGEVYVRVLASINWDESKEAEAISVMEDLAGKTKNKSHAYLALSEFYEEMDCPKSAESTRRTAELLGEIYDPVAYNIDSMLKNGDVEGSLAETKKYLAQYGSNGAAVQKLCGVIEKNKAEFLMEELLSSKNIPEGLISVVKESNLNLLLLTGKVREASAALERLHYDNSLMASDGRSEKLEAAIAALGGDVADARARVERVVSKDNMGIDDAIGFVAFLKNIGAYSYAKYACSKALEKNPDSRALNYCMAGILADDGDVHSILEMALKHKMRYPLSALKALGSNPDSDRFIFIPKEEYLPAFELFSEMEKRILAYKKSTLRD